jgi:hypothetical protein
VKRLVMLVALAGCWRSAPQNPAPPPISNEAKPPRPAKAGESRQVARTATGGIIELQGDHAVALPEANELMSQHCGTNNYTITQEGQEAIGTDTLDGQPIRTISAWRVHYLCGDAP